MECEFALSLSHFRPPSSSSPVYQTEVQILHRRRVAHRSVACSIVRS